MRGGPFVVAFALAATFNFSHSHEALAWGDEGHEVVALVAQSFLDPDVRKKVTALLAAGADALTAHDMASEATWPDKYRDANIDGSRQRTTFRSNSAKPGSAAP